MEKVEFTEAELKVLYDFLRSDDVFHAANRSSVDFVVNRIAAAHGGKAEMWEVFDPRDGIPVATYEWEESAALHADCAGLDYARKGDGW